MTLDAVSRLAGQGDVIVRSMNSSAWWSAHPTASTPRSPRLPTGTAFVIFGARPPQPVYLTRWWDYPPFSDARLARLLATLAPVAGKTAAPALLRACHYRRPPPARAPRATSR
jgi:hypothetical protein